MHAIGGADRSVTMRVIDAWAAHAPNRWSGRRLPSLFAAAGLVDVTITADTIISVGMGSPPNEPFTTMADTARSSGAVNREEAQRWPAQLADANAAGSFLWAITMFLVGGRRPQP